MRDGNIIEHGTHDELLNSSDIYKEVYMQQIGGDDNE